MAYNHVEDDLRKKRLLMKPSCPVTPDRYDELSAAALDLPGPRIWKLKDLAAFFGFTLSWAYKIMSADDPPPRCPGLKRPRFDTHSPAFQSWVARQLGYYDSSVDTLALSKIETAQRKQDAGHHENGGNGDGP